MKDFFTAPPKRGGKTSAASGTGFLPFLMARTPTMGEKQLGQHRTPGSCSRLTEGGHFPLLGKKGSGTSGAFTVPPQAGQRLGDFSGSSGANGQPSPHLQERHKVARTRAKVRLPRAQTLQFLYLRCGRTSIYSLSHRWLWRLNESGLAKCPAQYKMRNMSSGRMGGSVS